MPSRSSTRENGGMNRKNKGKEKSRANGQRDASPANNSNEDLQNVTRHLKRLTKVAEVLNVIMPEEKLDAAERAFKPQLEREIEIERLNNALGAMREEREHERASWDEKGQELKRTREEFERKMRNLQREKAEAESYRKGYEKEMLDKQEKMLKEEKGNLAQRKREEVAKIEGRLERSEKSNKLMEREKLGLSEELRDTKKKLKSQEMAREGLEMKISKLEADQEKLKSDVAVTSKPTEFYTRKFRELSDTIHQVVNTQFTALPEGLEDKYEILKSALRKLEPLSEIFKYTPAASDTVSDFLRLLAVEQSIATKICTFINKPFIDGCSPPEHDGGASLLNMIQQELSRHSKRGEDIWTALTVKAMEPQACKNSLKERIVQEILKKFEEIRDPRNSQQLENSLISIVDTALELWTALRSDNCRMELSFKPELAEKEMWFIQKTPSFEAGQDDDNDGQSAILESIEKPHSFALFPRVVIFHDNGDTAPNNEGIKEEIVYKGRALFSDSDTFIRGIKHQRVLEELYHQHISDFSHLKKKSLSSPVTDKGFSFQFPVQKS